MPKYVRADGISPGFRLDQILASGDSTDSPMHTLLVKCQIGSRAHEDGVCTWVQMAKTLLYSHLPQIPSFFIVTHQIVAQIRAR
jgi:hypothetical protein